MGNVSIARAAILKALSEIENEIDRLPGAHRSHLSDDRSIFNAVVRNEPGPGRPIKNPENHDFLRIDEIDEGDISNYYISECVLDAEVIYKNDREYMFQQIVGLVHRLKDNFEVYLGRTFVRKNAEHRGPKQRWLSHFRRKEMVYARPLFRVPRGRITRDELIGIGLVNVWSQLNILCCNNNVILASGNISSDPWQLIYLCIKPLPRRARRVSIQSPTTVRRVCICGGCPGCTNPRRRVNRTCEREVRAPRRRICYQCRMTR